ncbi:hypothetical protein KUF71_024281 [Frankliniella fusca]|uniref:Uncharacterized protein n=1 Tax=Frankliniella fusca TaxID=407009 RepID=A0AAE1H4L4_9NEOP|nr:hypothetical protein KUF71_024281 [Frankliniella fusca]
MYEKLRTRGSARRLVAMYTRLLAAGTCTTLTHQTDSRRTILRVMRDTFSKTDVKAIMKRALKPYLAFRTNDWAPPDRTTGLSSQQQQQQPGCATRPRMHHAIIMVHDFAAKRREAEEAFPLLVASAWFKLW